MGDCLLSGLLGLLPFRLFPCLHLGDDSLYGRHPFRFRQSGKVLQAVLQLYGVGVRHQFVQYLRAFGDGGVLPVALVRQAYRLGIGFLCFGIVCLLPVEVPQCGG